MNRHAFMSRPVSVCLQIIGIRPEQEAVLDDVPGVQRADCRPAPDPSSENAPIGIRSQDGGKAIDEQRGSFIRLGIR